VTNDGGGSHDHADGFPRIAHATSHSQHTPEELHAMLSPSSEFKEKYPNLPSEPFDLRLLRHDPEFVFQHIYGFHPALNGSCKFMKGIQAMTLSKKCGEKDWSTEDYVASAQEAERRRGRQAWGGIVPATLLSETKSDGDQDKPRPSPNAVIGLQLKSEARAAREMMDCFLPMEWASSPRREVDVEQHKQRTDSNAVIGVQLKNEARAAREMMDCFLPNEWDSQTLFNANCQSTSDPPEPKKKKLRIRLSIKRPKDVEGRDEKSDAQCDDRSSQVGCSLILPNSDVMHADGDISVPGQVSVVSTEDDTYIC